MTHDEARVEKVLDPPFTLRRIAFLLERAQAPTYRVQAFGKAAAAIDEAGPDEVVRLAKLGRLNDLPGIGDTTEWIVIEAVGGQTPAYPAKFETTEFRPRVTGGEELRALREGDCYTRSDWSDGASPIREIALAGEEFGHDLNRPTDDSVTRHRRPSPRSGLRTALRVLRQAPWVTDSRGPYPIWRCSLTVPGAWKKPGRAEEAQWVGAGCEGL